MWILLISHEVTNSRKISRCDRFFMGLYDVSVQSDQFLTPQMALAVGKNGFTSSPFKSMRWFSWTWLVA
jgi:hypothetical protein